MLLERALSGALHAQDLVPPRARVRLEVKRKRSAMDSGSWLFEHSSLDLLLKRMTMTRSSP